MRFISKKQLLLSFLVILIAFMAFSCKSKRLDAKVYKSREKLITLGYDFTEESFLKAIDKSDMDLVKLFIDSGMSPDTVLKIKDIPIPVIFYALEKGNDLVVQLLIHSGANINNSVKDVTVLMKAVEKANVDTLSLMLKEGVDVNKTGENGLTALMTSIERKNSGATWLLLKSGADVNKADKNGITPLMRALKTGETDIVRELIKKGADVNAISKNGLKTSKTLGKENREEITLLLKDAGAEF